MNAEYEKVLATILSIVARSLKEDYTLSEDTVLQVDIGMTSLQVMELILEIEEEFDISFPLNRLPDIQTIRDMAREIVVLLG